LRTRNNEPTVPHLVQPWDHEPPTEATIDLPSDDEHIHPLPDTEPAIPTPTPTVRNVEPPPIPATVTRSGRSVRRPQRLIAAIALFLTTFSPQPIDGTALHLLQPDVEAYAEPHPFALFTEHVVAFVGSDPDTMTLDEALKDPDRDQFIEAMRKELMDHVGRKHWKVVPGNLSPSTSTPYLWYGE
jgi:hypothetical protein